MVFFLICFGFNCSWIVDLLVGLLIFVVKFFMISIVVCLVFWKVWSFFIGILWFKWILVFVGLIFNFICKGWFDLVNFWIKFLLGFWEFDLFGKILLILWYSYVNLLVII